ncbi:phage tail protein [Tropicibacter oceani]|uniref:Tail fiber protein n=1 Tax=Tropicibacter oceani TaxID=3058420 RepID=A0ABY8QG39_9RHOB|nr:tail fiber protein [Tropicibacter oceani]WGW02973.1 tail fiber protein [Tropicibacter oceani]
MSEPYLGQVYLVGYNFATRGFALCQGQLLPIAQYSALFSLLGTFYGGDGRTNFGLPDMRGRTAIGFGDGPGLTSRNIGQKGGTETVTLTTAQIPAHSHTASLRAEGRNGNADDPGGNMIAKNAGGFRPQVPAEDVTLNPASVSVENAGGGQGHANMQPYIVMNYQIALAGVYPSRS